MHRRLVISAAVGVRNYSALVKPKRFYKKVSIVQSGREGWEVNLDTKKLKTPGGSVFRVDNEGLAAAVATEWQVQKEHIERHNMHLTALSNTAQDNPQNKTKESLCEEIVEYLENDSILFRMPPGDHPEMNKLQCSKWDPILSWFCSQHHITLQATTDVVPHPISNNDMMSVYKHLYSYSRTALFGYQFAVECLKSLVLAQATVDKRVSVQEAVYLSRLEVEYQTQNWGSVEWAHGLDEQQVQARLAAGVLFVQLAQEAASSVTKGTGTQS